jgi:hypothetical protein
MKGRHRRLVQLMLVVLVVGVLRVQVLVGLEVNDDRDGFYSSHVNRVMSGLRWDRPFGPVRRV